MNQRLESIEFEHYPRLSNQLKRKLKSIESPQGLLDLLDIMPYLGHDFTIFVFEKKELDLLLRFVQRDSFHSKLSDPCQLVSWADWILKEDIMLMKSGISHLNSFELNQLLLHRGYSTSKSESTAKESQNLLNSHLKFSKRFYDSVVKLSKTDQEKDSTIGLFAALMIYCRCKGL